jgi:hypothetical protein
MKLKALTTIILYGLLLLPLAHAQLNVRIKGNIPFNFRIGDTRLPAGTYVVSQTEMKPSVLAMQNLDSWNKTPVMFGSSRAQAKSTPETKLVFHRYADTYFLSQVWQGEGSENGLQLMKSKAERVIEHQMASAPVPHYGELATITFYPHLK